MQRFFVFGSVATAFLLMACTPPPHTTTGLLFRDALGTDIAFSDPHKADERASVTVTLNTFEGLMRINNQTGLLELGLAQSCQVSPDGLTYTIHLKENLRFSDGVAINAQTFLDSWTRALDPQTMSSNAYMLAHVLSNGDAVLAGDLSSGGLGVRVKDDLTLEVTLSRPAPYFLDILARPVAVALPMHLVRENPTGWNHTFPLVSSGAFVLEEWRPSARIVLTRNPNYHEVDQVVLDKVILYTGDDLNTAYSQYVNGEVDRLAQISPDKIVEAQDREDFHSNFYYNGEYYLFNTERKPFDDVRVRRALNLAIDRTTLTDKVLGASEVPLYAMISQQPGYTTRNYFSEDLSAARSLLADAGFPDGEGFPSFTILYNTNESNKRIAEFIQEQWHQNLGIHATLANLEWKTFLSTIDAFDYDVTRSSWMPDYPDPTAWLQFFDSRAIYSNYRNSAFDDLLSRANTLTNEQARMQALQKAEEKLMADLPFMPLYTKKMNTLWDSHKWQWHINPVGIPFYRSLQPRD